MYSRTGARAQTTRTRIARRRAARFALISTLSRYQEQLRQLRDVKAAIDEHGTMISMRDSYGRTVLPENPAVATFGKLTKQANATAAELMRIYNKFK